MTHFIITLIRRFKKVLFSPSIATSLEIWARAGRICILTTHLVNPKPKRLIYPITVRTGNQMNQSDLETYTCGWRQAHAREQ